MTPELKNLLEKYADTCTAIARLQGEIEYETNEGNTVPDSVFASLRSVEKRKADLEREIVELWGSAEEAGAARSRQQVDEADEQVVAERDRWEEFIAYLARRLGCEDEWSNLHDHRECIDAALTTMGK